MDRLLKNKEPFTGAYFVFPHLICIPSTRISFLFAKYLVAYHPDDMQQKALHLWHVCGTQKPMKYQNRTTTTLTCARRGEAGPDTLIKRSPDRTPSCVQRTNI